MPSTPNSLRQRHGAECRLVDPECWEQGGAVWAGCVGRPRHERGAVGVRREKWLHNEVRMRLSCLSMDSNPAAGYARVEKASRKRGNVWFKDVVASALVDCWDGN